jgi:colanic acid/amylovoran biosynthesis protein
LRLLPDLGFAFHGGGSGGISSSEVDGWFDSLSIARDRRQPLLGVTVIDWGAQNRSFISQSSYEGSIAAAIRHYVQKYNGVVLLLPQCIGPSPTEDDRLPARRVASLVADLGHSVLMIDRQPGPGLLKLIFGELDMLIGTRMHSNIFAISQNVPVIAVGYLHKTQGIAEMVGIDGWVLDIQTIREELLIQAIDRLWVEREAVRSHLAQIIPAIIQDSRLAGKLIAVDYASIVHKSASN